MKMTNILIVSMCVLSITVSAQTSSSTSSPMAVSTAKPKNPKSINAQQRRQEKRIEQGVASGELTNKEAAKLNARQAKIQKEENRMRADGSLSNKERAKLQHDLKKSDKAINYPYGEKKRG